MHLRFTQIIYSRGVAMGADHKINCWEYMRCERQPGGNRSNLHGVCPAAIDRMSDGTNSGINAGRFCWAIAGTYCFGEVQGSYAMKFEGCMDCGFFWKVVEEEDDFTVSGNCLYDSRKNGSIATIEGTPATGFSDPPSRVSPPKSNS